MDVIIQLHGGEGETNLIVLLRSVAQSLQTNLTKQSDSSTGGGSSHLP